MNKLANKTINRGQATDDGQIMALDVGTVRIGIALARTDVKLPKPFATFAVNDSLWDKFAKLLKEQKITEVVVGLPRGLDGQETEQTKTSRRFAEEFQQRFKLEVSLQDEAVTSLQSESRLRDSGKGYNKSMIDAGAATIILEDYVRDRKV